MTAAVTFELSCFGNYGANAGNSIENPFPEYSQGRGLVPLSVRNVSKFLRLLDIFNF
jgi:hypothetical protein